GSFPDGSLEPIRFTGPPHLGAPPAAREIVWVGVLIYRPRTLTPHCRHFADFVVGARVTRRDGQGEDSRTRRRILSSLQPIRCPWPAPCKLSPFCRSESCDACAAGPLHPGDRRSPRVSRGHGGGAGQAGLRSDGGRSGLAGRGVVGA